MIDMRLVVDPKTLRGGIRGPATGSIWIVVGRLAFPLQDWNDFVVVILEAWTAALVRLLRGVRERERVHFMEGPYLVEVSLRSPGVVHIRAIERGAHEQERASEDVRTLDFIDALLVCAEEILAACRQKGCWSVDAAKLQAAMPMLRDQAAKLPN